MSNMVPARSAHYGTNMHVDSSMQRQSHNAKAVA